MERIYLTELISFYPSSILISAARNRNARSLYDSGNYQQFLSSSEIGLSAINSTVSGAPVKHISDREIEVLRAKALIKLGRVQEARTMLDRIISETPDLSMPDDHSLAAVSEIDRLEAKAPPGGISDDEHFRRAAIYQFNRDFPDARRHYTAIIENFPASTHLAESLFQIGRGWVQARELGEAVTYFERIGEQFPDDPIAADALLQSASAFARLGKQKEALARYHRFIDTFPDNEKVDRADLNIVDTLRDANEETDAIQWAKLTESKFKGKPAESVALFAQAAAYFWLEAIGSAECPCSSVCDRWTSRPRKTLPAAPTEQK